MPAPISQTELAARLRRDIAAFDRRLDQLKSDLSEHEFAWKPPTGGWSVGQVLEHMVVANDSYLPKIEELVHAAGERRAADATWRPTFMGRFLAASLRSPRKLPAPKIWVPAPVPRAHVVPALHEQHRRLQEYLDASEGLEWRRLRTTSPVSRLIPLNLGDCFEVLVVHTARHLDQIDRLRTEARQGAQS